MKSTRTQSTRTRALLVAAAAVLVLGACGSGGYQRGIFTGFVVDATEADIVAKIGKPDRIDAAESSAPKWVYKKKTFDPDNMNRTDEETIVVMRKDAATGALKGAEVLFL
jgi:hypothetical protein